MAKKTAADFFNEGNAHFIDGKFARTVRAYDQGISASGSELKPQYFARRAIAKIQLGKFQDAIVDLNIAINLDKTYELAYYHEARALFSLAKYMQCKKLIISSPVSIRKSNKMVRIMRKSLAELELTGETDTAESSSSSSDDDAKRKKEATKSFQTERTAPDAENSMESEDALKSKFITPDSKKSMYTTSQTDTHIFVHVNANGVKKDDVDVDFGKSSIAISIPLDRYSEYNVFIDLLREIDPEKTSIAVHKTKVTIKALKKPSGAWKRIEASDYDKKANSKNTAQTTNRNWDAIGKQIKKEADELPTGVGDPLNNLFTKIYKDATPETRMAMKKSYIQSKGTVLNCNWKEVGDKNIKSTPPQGMEFKNWDQ